LDEFRRELDSLFDRRAGLPPVRGGAGGVYPPTNLYETADAYVLTAELPGVEPDDIHVSIEDSTVSIHGERKSDHENHEDASLHRVERQAGSFRRAFSLPRKVDADKVDAVHKNGVLMLRVPKSPEARARQIAVRVS
jgi:HSP20 family protein